MKKHETTGSFPGIACGDGVRRSIAAATVREARTERKLDWVFSDFRERNGSTLQRKRKR